MVVLDLQNINTALSITTEDDFRKFNKYLFRHTGEEYPADLFQNIGDKLCIMFEVTETPTKECIELNYKLLYSTLEKCQGMKILKCDDYRYYLDNPFL